MKSHISVSNEQRFAKNKAAKRIFGFRTLSAVCFLLTLAAFVARAEILPIKTYTSSDGLIYEGVIKIYQDSRGFVWLTTPVGISRFDGYQFTKYGIEDGLFNTLMTDMVEDEKGVYWFGTMGGVVYRFDSRAAAGAADAPAKKFEDFKISDAGPYINRIYKTSRGEIYFATAAGLFRLDESRSGNEKFVPVEIDPRQKNAPVTNLVEDAAGSLWISYQYGLIRRLPDGTSVAYAVTPNEKGSDLVRTLALDGENRLWMTTEERHLIVFNPEPVGSLDTADRSKRQLRFSPETKLAAGLAQGYAYRFTAEECPGDGAIRAIRPTRDGRIWLAAYRKGLLSFDGREFRLYTKANGLSNDVLTALMEDSFGNLWIGSDWGAMKLARKGFVTYNMADGLLDERIVTLFQDRRDGTLYATSPGWTINRFDGRKFEAIKLNIPAPQANWLSRKIMLDGAGGWWFATEKGLYRYTGIEKLEQINSARPAAVYTTADGLPSDSVFGVFEDSFGNVWLSDAEKGDHLTVWNRETNKFQSFNKADGIAESCFARHFREDAAGNLYFGCSAEHIVVRRQGKFFSFRSQYLPEGWWVGDIYIDAKGRMWVASPTKGLVRIENLASGAPVEKLYTTADGLSSIHVQFITEDASGKIYFVTSSGMDVLEPESGKVKQYTLADGLAAAGTGTAIRDRVSGDIWLGVSRGISRFTPEADKAPVAPAVFIGSVRVAGREVPVSALGETEVSDLTLEADQRHLQIDFYGLNLSSGEALRYQYRLEGADAGWSEPTAQRSVNLNLAPGGYKFLVRAVTLEGTQSETPASVSFRILRPIWQRWWFLTALALLAAGLIYAFYRYRLRRLLELEKVRTRIATDLHDDLGASLSKIAILSEIVNHQVAPVAKNPEIEKSLSEIAGTSREMVDSMADIVWMINPERDRLSDLIGRLRSLANEMTELYDISTQIDSSGVQARELNLGADLRREIYLIFKETLNNLIKHSGAERVQIEFRLAGDDFVLTVSDDGRGFDAHGNGNGKSRGGNGLPNMKRRAAALGGSLRIESKPGAGTTVRLRVPLKQKIRLSAFLSK